MLNRKTPFGDFIWDTVLIICWQQGVGYTQTSQVQGQWGLLSLEAGVRVSWGSAEEALEEALI